MSKIEKTTGIVIKCRDLTETSQIVWFYTKDFGKIKTVAKGSRANKKQFKSKLDLFTLNEIIFYHNPRKELHTLSESEIIEPFTAIRTDIDKMAVATYIIDLLENLTPIEDKNEKIYDLLLKDFNILAVTKKADFFRIVFEIKILQFSGIIFKPKNISKAMEAIIKKIMKTNNIKSLNNLKITKSQFIELRKVVRLIVDYSLGKRLKSLDFLEEVISPQV